MVKGEGGIMGDRSGRKRPKTERQVFASFYMQKLGLVIAILAPLTPVSAASQQSEVWQRWMPQSYVRAGDASTLALAPQQRWWSEFSSPELDELIAITMANNRQLNAVTARIAQAEARMRAANGGRAPTIDAIARAEYRAPEFGIGTAPTRADFTSRQIYQAGLRVAYEVDLWGKGAYRQEAAMQQLKSSQFAREALAQTLVADVTTTYFTVLALRERVALAEQNYATAQLIGQTIERRVARGDLALLDQEQQALTATEVGAQLYQLRQLLAAAEGNLAFLTGRPLNMLQLSATSLSDIKIPNIAPGVPASIVCRRPDIRRAEADLMAARADLRRARTGLLPTFSLTAEGGYGTSDLSRALSPQSLFTDLVGQLVQSIFDGGQRKAAIAEQSARQKELLENYQGSILAALRDTEEALAGVQLTDARWTLFSNASARSAKLVSMTQRVFDRGALDYTSLLESQRTQFRTADLAVVARLERLRASVDLFKALGGGLSEKDESCQVATGADPAASAPDAGAPSAAAGAAPDKGAAAPSDAAARRKKKPARW
jgi:NodT family efflux transporter outer membrane factor (OMF) lipoprotein